MKAKAKTQFMTMATGVRFAPLEQVPQLAFLLSFSFGLTPNLNCFWLGQISLAHQEVQHMAFYLVTHTYYKSGQLPPKTKLTWIWLWKFVKRLAEFLQEIWWNFAGNFGRICGSKICVKIGTENAAKICSKISFENWRKHSLKIGVEIII